MPSVVTLFFCWEENRFSNQNLLLVLRWYKHRSQFESKSPGHHELILVESSSVAEVWGRLEFLPSVTTVPFLDPEEVFSQDVVPVPCGAFSTPLTPTSVRLSRGGGGV